MIWQINQNCEYPASSITYGPVLYPSQSRTSRVLNIGHGRECVPLHGSALEIAPVSWLLKSGQSSFCWKAPQNSAAEWHKSGSPLGPSLPSARGIDVRCAGLLDGVRYRDVGSKQSSITPWGAGCWWRTCPLVHERNKDSAALMPRA